MSTGLTGELGLVGLGGASVAIRRLVIVPVGEFDVRAARAVQCSLLIPAQERRALHVATDERMLWALADAWMGRGQSLPLQTVEDAGGVPATLARVVRFELASGFDEVIVLAGRLRLRHRVHRLLHDRTADRMARAVSPIPNAIVALLSVATI